MTSRVVWRISQIRIRFKLPLEVFHTKQCKFSACRYAKENLTLNKFCVNCNCLHLNNETFISIWSISFLITFFEWFEHGLPYFSIHYFSETFTISYTLETIIIDPGILRWHGGKQWSCTWTLETWLTPGILCFDETIIWSWARHLLSV